VAVSGVVVAVLISGVVVATDGSSITGGVLVAASDSIIGGVVVGVVGGIGSLVGIIVAGAPEFCVAPPVVSAVEPHAPSEVFIMLPSIYIHFGAAVERS